MNAMRQPNMNQQGYKQNVGACFSCVNTFFGWEF